jgi:hypothetical protein
MADSPAKRRKTSPATSVPTDAPATPSRIPVPRKDGAKTTPRRPSFASPTKASLAKHHPQLLNRPSSSGSGSARPGSQGKDLQDVYAKASGETQSTGVPSVITGEEREQYHSNGFTTQENELLVDKGTETQRATTPSARSARSVGGGLSAKPKRMSRSPAKQRAKTPVEDSNATAQDNYEEINPFQKRGLRRSPVTSQVEAPVQEIQESLNPFRKAGLRRSPMSSQTDAAVPETLDPHRKSGLRRSPVAPTPAFIHEEMPVQNQSPVETSSTPTGPLLSHAGVAELLERALVSESVDVADEVVLPQQPHVSEMTSTAREQEPVIAIERPAPSGSQPLAPGTTSKSSKEQAAVTAPEHHPPRARPQSAEATRSNRREEPELPPTPAQRGIPDPVVTTPPIGIHDTPSKRARKNKALAGKLKSSPLKPRDPPPEEPSKQVTEAAPQLKPEPEKVPKRRKSARFLLPEDPHASKKKARDDLLKELQQLQADVALANAENGRLRQRSESKKTGSGQPAKSDELLAMLLRATAPETAAKPKPTSIFQSIGSFLPFRPRRRKHAQLPISDKPVPSHLPIALEDPLPYLQVFTPLTFISTITILPSDHNSSEPSNQDLDPPIRQKHVIHASHPSGLFASRFSMTVDTSTLSITSLDILRLDMNAETELGTFIRDRARRDGPLGKDVSTVCWAMGRWTEVSIQRARFWCAVENEFGTAQARSTSLSRLRKRKRKRHASVAEDEEELNAEGDEAKESSAQPKWTRKQLLPQIGRTSMELSNEEVELRFEWKIRFDWTGEVDSHIAAIARLPRNCKSPSLTGIR